MKARPKDIYVLSGWSSVFNVGDIHDETDTRLDYIGVEQFTTDEEVKSLMEQIHKKQWKKNRIESDPYPTLQESDKLCRLRKSLASMLANVDNLVEQKYADKPELRDCWREVLAFEKKAREMS
jgi:hypothetical protein